MGLDRWEWPQRHNWVDIAWVVFVGLNLIAMRLIPAWQTVPFLIIWVSLTAIYGFRLWRLQPTIVTLAAVTLATGGVIGAQVLKGQEDAEYLVEVPLIAMMFLVMVWHARRRITAMEDIERVSGENLRLLERERRFVQDASHELRTPITVALGHAELIERAASDPMVAQDARVIADELERLRRLADRLLLLAGPEDPDFLHTTSVDVGAIVLDAFHRWAATPRRWLLGDLDDAWAKADPDRLAVALDALIENAVSHTRPDDSIELAVRRDAAIAVISVRDSGSGIPPADLDRIFHRFARADAGRSRNTGGFGLGLSIVKAIAEAHDGSVGVRSTPGKGSVFEILLPATPSEVPSAGLLSPEREPACGMPKRRFAS
jgi:signal transduction histidine kinase